MSLKFAVLHRFSDEPNVKEGLINMGMSKNTCCVQGLLALLDGFEGDVLDV